MVITIFPNFQTERHFIMQVVCETTQSPDVKVKVAALQCLVRIMSLYYQYMETYMGPALFAITLEVIYLLQGVLAIRGLEFRGFAICGFSKTLKMPAFCNKS